MIIKKIENIHQNVARAKVLDSEVKVDKDDREQSNYTYDKSIDQVMQNFQSSQLIEKLLESDMVPIKLE